MNSLGWSRRDPDIPVNTSSTPTPTPILSRLQSLNPFSGRGGYVSLPTQEGPGAPLPAPSRREEEEGFFAREWHLFVPARLCDGTRVPACPFLSHAYHHASLRLASPRGASGLYPQTLPWRTLSHSRGLVLKPLEGFSDLRTFFFPCSRCSTSPSLRASADDSENEIANAHVARIL